MILELFENDLRRIIHVNGLIRVIDVIGKLRLIHPGFTFIAPEEQQLSHSLLLFRIRDTTGK